MHDFLDNHAIGQWIPRVALLSLLVLSFMVLHAYLLTLIWALIIAYATWPVYQRLKICLGNRETLSATIMTTIIAVLLLVSGYQLANMLQLELKSLYQSMASTFKDERYQLPPAVQQLPGIGAYLQEWLDRIHDDREGVIAQLMEAAKQWLGQALKLLGSVGQSIVKLGVILVTVFFCFRDGQRAVTQVHRGLIHYLGQHQQVYLQAIGQTTRAVVYGLVLAAMAQGAVAGVGYAVAGIQAPVLFGMVTALLAMVPMGATLIWLPLGILLLLTDQYWQGVGLLLWGLLAISTVDNVVRPLVISGASRVPLLVVMFGVLGGLSEFGGVGLFLGPVILAVLLAVWRAWISETADEKRTANEAAASANLAQSWHDKSVAQVLSLQAVDADTGLTQADATQRLHTQGANRLLEKPAQPLWRLLLAQFQNILVLILIAAALLAAMIGELKDGAVILVVVVINACLGFYQEFQAEQSLAALKNMLALNAKVRRDGKVKVIPAEQLVPGDVVLLEAGDKIPADGRIILAHSLEVDESSLTGESMPVSKQVHALAAEAIPLAERNNLLFMNNAITRGRAEMVVTATGMATEIGRLAALLAEVEEGQTPLQAQLDNLGKRLAFIAVSIIVLLVLAALWRGEPLMQTLLTAIALAIAAIPEGLPAVVTVTLALGMHRMARQRAIVKRLSAVETLGCTSVICTDKTGTLTVNQMTARAVYYQHTPFEVSGEGYSAEGTIQAHPGQTLPDLTPLLQPLVLCNDSHIQPGKQVGDPMECALLVLAAKGGLDRQHWQQQWPRCAEIPFDAAHKFMVTFHPQGENIVLFVKGAPEIVLAHCATEWRANGTDTVQTDKLLEQNNALAAQGLRVLGVATRTIPAADFVADGELFEYVNDLTFIALIGLMDPPRAEVQAAINLCQQAGITVKMITGDQEQTAAAIGQSLGLTGEVINGSDLALLDDETLTARIDAINIFARTAPEQKVRIVKALQAKQRIVAMTGDGVNDAPALKTADIGIAMGMSGTDVAKEAASMILTDDNFATIAKAVKEGRGIYDNMVKFVRFQLSTNIGAILSVACAPLLGLPLPFSAIQLLWINIIMDGPPAMSLGVDPCRADSMRRAPRDPHARILSLARFGNLLAYGMTMAVGTLGLLYYDMQHGDPQHAATLAFTAFVLFQVFNVFNARNEYGSAFNRDFFSNRYLWLALSAVVALQVLVVHWPPAQGIFKTTALTASDWLLAIGVAASIWLLEETRKLLQRYRR